MGFLVSAGRMPAKPSNGFLSADVPDAAASARWKHTRVLYRVFPRSPSLR